LVPPFPGVAINDTEDPWQKGFCEEMIDTDAGNSELTTIVMALEVTVRLPV
jgi:hypothetical protein